MKGQECPAPQFCSWRAANLAAVGADTAPARLRCPHSITQPSCDTLWPRVRRQGQQVGMWWMQSFLQAELWDVCLIPAQLSFGGNTKPTQGCHRQPGCPTEPLGPPHPAVTTCHFSPLLLLCVLFSRDLQTPLPRRQGQEILFWNVTWVGSAGRGRGGTHRGWLGQGSTV